MTPREMFDSAYLRVSNALGLEPDADQADECYRAVQGYAASLYDEAASRLGSRCRFLPKPVEWAEALSAIERERGRATRTPQGYLDVLTAPTVCAECEDTGWARSSMVVRGVAYPSRRPCACRATNPNYRRRQGLPVTDPPKDEAKVLAFRYQGAEAEGAK